MAGYKLPAAIKRPKAKKKQIYLVASGDLRLPANQECWPAQKEMEDALKAAVAELGYELVRAHAYDPVEKHGFISSQKMGLEVFSKMDPDAPVIVAEAVWQYSHHVLPGLTTHRGPILTCANWSPTWPGLVGMLNLNASLTKAGKKFSTLWADDFAANSFKKQLKKWIEKRAIKHPMPHVTKLSTVKIPTKEKKLGEALAQDLIQNPAILGVFDEGCMGMYNGIIEDALLNPCGVFKERLSQSALCYEASQVTDAEAKVVLGWYQNHGMKFQFGPDEDKNLTERQVLQQCKMYVAAVRIADDFGCSVIGIQYQQGLKDMLPASDLVEGTLNNTERPPVMSRDGKRELYAGKPIVHFNEVDECSGLDGLLVNRVHAAMGQPIETTLHDVRWGDWDPTGTVQDYVWVFLISGAVPPAHFPNGWKDAVGMRQSKMYFPLGGSTIQGNSKPGEIIWSRIYIDGGKLHMDMGRAEVVALPEKETQRRLDLTSPQWPIMHAVLYGVSRDQFMAKHKANHIQVVYANSAKDADAALFTRAAMAEALGIQVNLCGTRKNDEKWD